MCTPGWAGRRLHPVSELLSRNGSRLDSGSDVCWINPPRGAPWQALGEIAPLRLFSQDFGAASELKAAGAPVEFGDFPVIAPHLAPHAILTLPRAKAALDMMLHCLATQLPASGRLWLAGENRAGIKSAKSHLAAHFGRVEKIDSARHCVLFEASKTGELPEFNADDFRSEYQASAGELTLTLVSWPGVFAHGRLDPGTALLLECLAGIEAPGKVLDFGTGCGVIAAFLGLKHPGLELVLSDNDALALRSAAATLALNGVNGKVVASHGFSSIEGRFDLLVSNPPFHQGHVTRTDLSMRLLADAGNFLNPGGQLLLVVNRHLPYRRWLDDTFTDHRVLASDNRYQVLSTTMP